MYLVIPDIFFDPVELPPIDGDHAKPTISINGRAQAETTTDVDVNIWLQTAESSI